MKRKMIATFLLIGISCTLLTGCKSSDYKKAVEYQEAGDYASALDIYLSIDGYDNYKDTAERINTCQAMIEAIGKFETASSSATAKNEELDTAISTAEFIIAENAAALNETLYPALESAISTAKAAKVDVPEMPATEDKILTTVEQLNAIDYSTVLFDLSTAQEALEKSIKQYALVDAPNESYIIQCLKTVPGIVDISAVTEDNDPNGNMNKAGGYTAQVFFSSDLIDQSSVYGTTVIEKGTNCGGSIEVYSNVDDAASREAYLATFDGGILASGSHKVIGTVLVRTSDNLTASQQKELEANIIAALTNIEE
jgi:hypothetical protein